METITVFYIWSQSACGCKDDAIFSQKDNIKYKRGVNETDLKNHFSYRLYVEG